MQDIINIIKANSHRHARHDTNYLVCVASASVVWTGFQTTQDCRRQKIWSLNTFTAIAPFASAHQTQQRQDRLVVSGVAVWTESSAFSVGVCRAAQALPVRQPDALRRRTHLSGGRADSIHIAWCDTNSTVLSRLMGGVNWAFELEVILRPMLTLYNIKNAVKNRF